MPELLVEDPQTGTKLRLDSDRQLERPQGDSVMRIQAQSPDGAQVFDAVYVELEAQEANFIAWLLHEYQHPSGPTQDKVAQEVQAAFSSKLTGRDAAQIAQIVGRAWWQAIQTQVGIGDEPETEQMVSKLSERFNRADSKRREPATSNGGSGSRSPRGTQAGASSSR